MKYLIYKANYFKTQFIFTCCLVILILEVSKWASTKWKASQASDQCWTCSPTPNQWLRKLWCLLECCILLLWCKSRSWRKALFHHVPNARPPFVRGTKLMGITIATVIDGCVLSAQLKMLAPLVSALKLWRKAILESTENVGSSSLLINAFLNKKCNLYEIQWSKPSSNFQNKFLLVL